MKLIANAAREQGSSHKDMGIPCQDAVETWRSADGSLAVIAAADGAGSRKNAKESAEAAVRSVITLFCKRASLDLPEEEMIAAFLEGQKALCLPEEELGTTLLFVAVKDNAYLAGHIGDGLILCREDGAFRLLSVPENGELSYQTYLLPGDECGHFRFSRGAASSGMSFLLATDGVSTFLCDVDSGAVAPACEIIDVANRTLSNQECRLFLHNALTGVFYDLSADDKSIGIMSIQ